MVAEHPVDAVACDRIAEPVEEDGLVGRTVAHKRAERVDSRRPKWAAAYLAALASELHVAKLVGTQVQIGDQQRRGLGDASPGVVEEQQERMIAAPLLGAAVGSREDSIHLWLVHIGEFVPCESLEWELSLIHI